MPIAASMVALRGGRMGVNARLFRAFAVLVAVVTAFILAVPLGGILGVMRGAQADPSETVLRIGFLQRIDSMNPYIGVNDASYILYGLVYDAMNVIDNQMQPTPDLALGVWAVPLSDPEMQMSGEPYGSVWQYNLTDQAFWHDGEPFTADDVVFNLNLNAHNFASMWAYQPYSFFMKDAEKIDEQTVRLHFYNRVTGDPMPAAYAYLMSIPMLPKHKLENMDPFTIGFNWTGLFPGENPPLVGTGPFMATSQLSSEWLAGDHITLVKNPNYHWKYTKAGAPEIKFDKLVMYFYDDATAMTYSLENKHIDIAAFPPTAYRNIKSDVASGNLKNITTFDGPKITQYWTYIGINANLAGPNPSRLDHNIRSAMAMATNKSYIVSQYYLGLADEGTTMIPPINSYWHYEPNATEKIPFDIEAARNLLEANGYIDIDADGIRECTAGSYAVTQNLVPEKKKLTYDMLIRREYPEEKDIAMYLQNVWGQIGIQLNYRIVYEAQLGTEAYGYAYDTFIWYWSADIDPNYQLYVQTKNAWGLWNDNRWTNDTYEQNYTKSVTALDKAQRKEYVDNCQRANYLDEYYMILAYPYQTYAWRDDTFTGWGDWAADPGRSMDNYWMGNPLFFDLLPAHTQPAASFEVNPDHGTVATVFSVDASSCSDREYPADQLEVRWDWEDDGTWDSLWTTDKLASHQYASPGNYTIRMEVRDPDNMVNQTTQSVVVVNTAPIASFAVSPSTGDLTTAFLFDAWSSSDLETATGALEVRWNWENDSNWDTSWTIAKTEMHRYSELGLYTVRLEVRDAGGLTCTDSLIVTVSGPPVANEPPVANAGFDQLVKEGATAGFNGSQSMDDGGVDALNFTWTFVYDGRSVALYGMRSTFAFKIPGTYAVTLKVKDAGNLIDTDTVTITVEQKAGISMTVWALIGTAIVVVALAAAFALMRKGRG